MSQYRSASAREPLGEPSGGDLGRLPSSSGTSQGGIGVRLPVLSRLPMGIRFTGRGTLITPGKGFSMNSFRKSFCVCLVLLPLIGSHASTGADDQQAPVPTAPLITRDRVQLNLAGAELILTAAKQKAAEQKWKMNISVVDDGGHLLAFARIDGARPASISTSITKAVTAATYRQETGPIGRPGGEGADVLLNISLQNAAQAGGGKLTTLKGGVPILVDGQVIGAIGVGGGTGEQDAEVAKAAMQAFTDLLAVKAN